MKKSLSLSPNTCDDNKILSMARLDNYLLFIVYSYNVTAILVLLKTVFVVDE
jgi:hypothetical protein